MTFTTTSSTPAPWVLFSLYKLQKNKRFQTFKTMGLAKDKLKPTAAMSFGAMLGTGSGEGFGLYPNWQRYSLLTCWNSQEAAIQFLNAAPLPAQLQDNSTEVWSVLMQPVMSRGSWGKKNPFSPESTPLEASEPVVVLTRARIHLLRLIEFWQKVPEVSASTAKAPGLLAKTGIGTLPLVEQATISVWESKDHIDRFAYKMQQHRQVVGLTRQRNWYSEELFARFRPLWTQGSWDNQELLPQLSFNNLK